ncbi:MAG TPA: hypothetical protein VN238_01120, partial [Solirubrobacteraceae bacterium]|nr:hypothetical protein [Solirubrobacteraceae bacterium]
MQRLSRTSFLTLALLALGAAPAFAQEQAPGGQPAGGAAIDQIAIATVGATVVTALLLWLGMGHRSGNVQLLGRAAAWTERISGLPGWAALPAGIATASLITAVFGMYWDIALHIAVGRDEGPLANPAHYFILVGLFGIFAAGFVSMVLPKEKPSDASISLGRGWDAPLGGVLICAAGAFSLTGFPLDDMWHRIFGQDVTLWGPTHLMLIGGAAMTLVGLAVLAVEGRRAAGHPGKPLARFLLAVWLPGGFMLGLSTFQAEFDFGVPQFRFVFEPFMIMLAAGVGLVTARMWGGRGSAIAAVAFFLVVRGLLTLIVDPVFGEPTAHMPLYIVEALVVEAIALRISTDKPLAFGIASGLGIGTIGLAAEWGWSHVWSPLPWPSELVPEGVIFGFAAAMAGALLGAWIGHRLSIEKRPTIPALRWGAVAGAAVVAVCVVVALQKPSDEGITAAVQLTEVQGGPERTVGATVRLQPADAGNDAEWLTMTAWQGDGLIVDRLERVSEGVYRTTKPVPVHGNWKALIRLHHGRSLTAVPIFMPRDEAIPAKEVPALASFERPFVSDHTVLQREQKPAAGWVTALAYGVVVLIALSLLVLLAWGLHRLATADGTSRPRRRAAASSAP